LGELIPHFKETIKSSFPQQNCYSIFLCSFWPVIYDKIFLKQFYGLITENHSNA
jgi:hypothetical protein